MQHGNEGEKEQVAQRGAAFRSGGLQEVSEDAIGNRNSVVRGSGVQEGDEV
jgi:hypothetical protein